MHSDSSPKIVLKAVVGSAVYYTAVSIVSTELVLLNTRFAPTVPWSILTVGLVLWFGFSVVKKRLNCNSLRKRSSSTSTPITFVLAATICCLSVAIIQGRVSEALLAPFSIGIATDSRLALAYAISMPVYAAITEEVAFRGILQGHLASQFGSMPSAVTSALLFVIAHAWKPTFASQFGLYFAMAVATASITARSGYLLPATAIHALTNLVLALMPLVAGSTVLLQFSPESLVGVLVVAVVAMLTAISAYLGLKKASPE